MYAVIWMCARIHDFRSWVCVSWLPPSDDGGLWARSARPDCGRSAGRGPYGNHGSTGWAGSALPEKATVGQHVYETPDRFYLVRLYLNDAGPVLEVGEGAHDVSTQGLHRLLPGAGEPPHQLRDTSCTHTQTHTHTHTHTHAHTHTRMHTHAHTHTHTHMHTHAHTRTHTHTHTRTHTHTHTHTHKKNILLRQNSVVTLWVYLLSYLIFY